MNWWWYDCRRSDSWRLLPLAWVEEKSSRQFNAIAMWELKRELDFNVKQQSRINLCLGRACCGSMTCSALYRTICCIKATVCVAWRRKRTVNNSCHIAYNWRRAPALATIITNWHMPTVPTPRVCFTNERQRLQWKYNRQEIELRAGL